MVRSEEQNKASFEEQKLVVKTTAYIIGFKLSRIKYQQIKQRRTETKPELFGSVPAIAEFGASRSMPELKD